jgi:hypothetical protein
VRAQDRTQDRCLAWKFVTELDTGKSRLARFAQARFETGLRAERRQIVVGPGQRIDAESNAHDVFVVR